MVPVYSLPPKQGVFSRFLSLVALLATLALSFFLGLIVFLVILGLVLFLALGLYLRLRWLRGRVPRGPSPGPPDGVTLEGEYTVSKRKQGR